MNIEKTHHRAEIGLHLDWSRVAAHGGEYGVEIPAAATCIRNAGCMRVELKTDALNEKSRAAILRIGAKEEGTFRNHMITSSGRIRQTVYFSIVDSEWPGVKSELERRLGS